jgi:hypothetical protein
MNLTLRIAQYALAGVIAVVVGQALARERMQADGRLTTADGDTVEITEAARRAGPTFAPDLTPADREWIVAAIARARPEAARLIAEVDGLVRFAALSPGIEELGVAAGGPRGFTVKFNLGRLDNDRAMDRATVVLHELGHVIDYALVPAALGTELDEQIPRGGPCGYAVECHRPEERFADTFAKWALNGAVSEVGAGYGIAMPASIESWGAPLTELAFSLPGR